MTRIYPMENVLKCQQLQKMLLLTWETVFEKEITVREGTRTLTTRKTNLIQFTQKVLEKTPAKSTLLMHKFLTKKAQ